MAGDEPLQILVKEYAALSSPRASGNGLREGTACLHSAPHTCLCTVLMGAHQSRVVKRLKQQHVPSSFRFQHHTPRMFDRGAEKGKPGGYFSKKSSLCHFSSTYFPALRHTPDLVWCLPGSADWHGWILQAKGSCQQL